MSKKDRIMEYLEITESKDEIEEVKESLNYKELGKKAGDQAIQVRNYLAEMALCLLPYGHTIQICELKTNGKDEISTWVCCYGIMRHFSVKLEPEKSWEEKKSEVKAIVISTFAELERQYVEDTLGINEKELSKARAKKEGAR